MAASKLASAGNANREYSRAPSFLGVAFACILTASCSVSDSDAQLDLAPASYGSPTLESLNLDTSGAGEGQASLPQNRPQRASDSQPAQTASAANTAELTQAETAQAETTNRPGASAQEGGQEEVPSQSAAPARDNTAPASGKRSLFAGLFSSPAATPADAQQKTVSDEAEKKVGAEEAESQPVAAADTASPQPKAEKTASEAPVVQDGQNPAKQTAAVTEQQSLSQKRGFLSAFFGSSAAKPQVPFPSEEDQTAKTNAAESQPSAEVKAGEKEKSAKPIITLASTSPTQAAMYSMDALPGVRPGEQLFEIRLGTLNDDGDVDIYEQEEGYYQVASAAGLARLAPNGLLKQRESVDVSCFKPKLVHVLKTIERRFGKRVVVTSGYRSPAYNRRVRGAPRSQHMNCAAADIVVEGVSKWELAQFARSLPGRGGVGTYCHTNAVHVDVGPERDWNWRCGRRG
uniref:Peptidase M15A n=1 Tax=Chelativorans sp. (strain BNC1) TaxID=266779 RepID=Q11H06_CHESB